MNRFMMLKFFLLMNLIFQMNLMFKLKTLTPYSPEYNPIESFWLRLKRKVYGAKSFQNIQDVIDKVRRFIWHYHENRLVDSIGFNFEPYAEILYIFMVACLSPMN